MMNTDYSLPASRFLDVHTAIYRHCELSSIPRINRKAIRTERLVSAAQFDLVTLDTPGVFTNLLEVYDEGYRRSKNRPFLGHRPVLSKKPLQYANYHVWQSWSEVDARRRALGSAVYKMFQAGELGGGDLDTVGIWSKNCPSM